MPSDFPGRPWLLKGALIVFGAPIPVPTNIIVFQYNPETMSRSFSEGDVASKNPTPSADRRRLVPPVESFSMTVDLDAADQLEDGNPLAIATGIHPALCALELLLFPNSTVQLLNKGLARLGMSMISPPKQPVVLLVWGLPRVVPVAVTSVGITETAFDQLLNPIQATVSLELRALTEAELRDAGVPFAQLGLVRQIAKEALARANIVNGAQEVARMLPF